MSKKKNRLPPFVYITKEMLNSPAFISLTNAARVTYLLLQAQISKTDQSKVKFPYTQAEKYMDRHTFTRAIKQLTNKGFIRQSQEGGLYRKTNAYEFLTEWNLFKKG
jgi:hypothetical protein